MGSLIVGLCCIWDGYSSVIYQVLCGMF